MVPLHLLPMYRQRKILSHHPVHVDNLHTRRLEVLAELAERVVPVELGAEEQTARPGEDGGDGVGRGFVALLVFAVVSGDGACLFRFEMYYNQANESVRGS